VKLIGIGGTGGTRLARKFAERLLGHYTKGAWWWTLAPLNRHKQVAPAIAQTVGCQMEVGRSREFSNPLGSAAQ
jgi:predicted ATPase